MSDAPEARPMLIINEDGTLTTINAEGVSEPVSLLKPDAAGFLASLPESTFTIEGEWT